MPAAVDIFLLIIILAGLLGTLLPSLPGTAIILLGALGHALVTDFQPLGWQQLSTLALLVLGGYLGQYLLAAYSSKRLGASRAGLLGACLGLLIGFFLPLPGGIFAGAFIGALVGELIFAGKPLGEAIQSGWGALIGTILSLFLEFMVGSGMVLWICSLVFPDIL